MVLPKVNTVKICGFLCSGLKPINLSEVNLKCINRSFPFSSGKSIYYVRNVRLRELRKVGWLFRSVYLFVYSFFLDPHPPFPKLFV